MKTTQLHQYISSIIDEDDSYALDVLYYTLRKKIQENGFSLQGVHYIEISKKFLAEPVRIQLIHDYSFSQRCITLLMSLRAIISHPSFFDNCDDDELFFKPVCIGMYNWVRYCSVILNNQKDNDFYNLFCILEELSYDEKISEISIEEFEQYTQRPPYRNLDNYYREIAKDNQENTKHVIVDNAFLNDSNLLEYVVNKDIEYIGDTAFSYCKRLEKITFLRPDTLFGKFPVIECPNLKYIIVPEESIDYYKEQLCFYRDLICTSIPQSAPKEEPLTSTDVEEEEEICESKEEFMSSETTEQETTKEEETPEESEEGLDIDIKKIESIFKHRSTTYKYFWFMAILDILNEKSELTINFNEIIAKMIALAWPLAQDRIGFGPQDNFPNIIQSLILTNTLELYNSEKEVEQIITEKYQEKKIYNILSILHKNVPYRFLSPWIKYTNDKEVMTISQSSECASPYALYEDYILLDESWYDYFKEHYQELYDMSKNELSEYLKKYNDGLKLLRFLLEHK